MGAGYARTTCDQIYQNNVNQISYLHHEQRFDRRCGNGARRAGGNGWSGHIKSQTDGGEGIDTSTI